MKDRVIVIGGGLAGSEAVYQLAKRGVNVILYEMRPVKNTPVHKTDKLGELVCSNSLKSTDIYNANGLLKYELKLLDSLILKAGEYSRIDNSIALVVDRELFSDYITNTIKKFDNVKIIREEVVEIPKDEIVIIATGPLTSEKLAEDIKKLTGEDYLSFYDAVSPIVDGDTLNYEKLFWADRFSEEGNYLNAPLNKEEYEIFVNELIKAEKIELHDFEKDIKFFEGCLPIEEMAKRGIDTLRYGPMNPKNLIDPRTGKEPYAVVQLRPENKDKTAFSLVGFQTQMKWNEQKRVFRLIPGLENAEFLRYGVIHRNTFIKSPLILKETLQMRKYENIFFAGQITGVEGYMPSCATGLIAGINAYRLLKNKKTIYPSRHTMIGALLYYITHENPKYFQPMNANFGLFVDIPKHLKGKNKKEFIIQRAKMEFEKFLKELSE
ncbi:MAG: methylenetetrahydrofolate--tRNA-(uracil(54)-C(5))-methyltransferase (FADH(2)-oxidizing) TrmFO [candidate division WOR-3 bacterium]|jgi:methylenetetrahydrofolate--tRNA-(uracil-5-)-methyltransferase